MASVIPPWPPEDYQAQQPYDQRGACWPWGPCSSRIKLPMRFDCIGRREFGYAVNLEWEGLATGVMAVVLADQTNKNEWFGVTRINIPPLPSCILTITRGVDSDLWPVYFSYWLYTDETVISWCIAEGFMTASSCESDIILPVTSHFGPVDPPDFIEVRVVKWWQTASYPFNV